MGKLNPLHIYRVLIFDREKERVMSWDYHMARTQNEAYEKSLEGHPGTVNFPNHKYAIEDLGTLASLEKGGVVSTVGEPGPKGKTGKTGKRGLKGDKGDRGIKGKAVNK